jgi:phosphoribosyl 1,2-cyclic phosphodiesterase
MSMYSILFSHVHWDHIQGIPFFQPIYIPGNQFKLYGNKNWDTRLEYALKLQMQSPNFPVTLEQLNAVGAKMEYIDIDFGTTFRVGNRREVTIRSVSLNHPDSAFGFKIEYAGKSMVYATDNENIPEPSEKLIELASEADLLIHDAQYTKEEYYGLGQSSFKGRGHSTPEAAAELATIANVGKLVLFHHDPYHDDAKIDEMLLTASNIFPNTVSAFEGMVIELQIDNAENESYQEKSKMSRVYYRIT